MTSPVAYLGPRGTFTEQALRTQDDLLALDPVPMDSIPDVLSAIAEGEVELGFVPIENAIEGSVNVTLDALAFETDLVIQREVVIDVSLNLLAAPGTAVGDVTHVLSFPVALAQCRNFLRKNLPDVTVVAANSTAEAARVLGEERPAGRAALGTALAAELYDLEVIASDVADHPENQTRFVVVARHGVPAPTGHDKTSLVIYQRRDAPGSLLAILQEFAARSINLTKLESRPTKRGLGDYCFLIDFEGHVQNEVVADCLRELKMTQGDVKFLGSYPAAGDGASQVRRDTAEAYEQAEAWVRAIRGQIG
jgi:prephenate dehydratase